MFQRNFSVRTSVSLLLLSLMIGLVSCAAKNEVNPHFDTNSLQPVVPSSSYKAISKRDIGPIFSVQQVTDTTTTILYDDAATKPCTFEVPTKDIGLKESSDDYSYLRLHYKAGVDQSKLLTCADLTANLSHVDIMAEPEVAKQFART